MLPERLLAVEHASGPARAGGPFVPEYLRERDHSWLDAVLEAHARAAGLRRAEWSDAIRAAARLAPRPGQGALVRRVLERECLRPPRLGAAPRRARMAAFAAGALRRGAPPFDRDAALEDAALRLGVDRDRIERDLLADLATEWRASPPPAGATASSLAHDANLALAQGLLGRAGVVRVRLEGHARRVVQQALWNGLVCTVTVTGTETVTETDTPRGTGPHEGPDEEPDEGTCTLSVSGPLEPVRHGALYARALAGLVPVLAWCPWFEVEARVLLRGQWIPLVLRSGDPVARGAEPRRHDSAVEAAFEADVARLAPDWQLVREPTAVASSGTIVFPDFLVRPADGSAPGTHVEIAACGRPGYLAAKLGRLRAAALPRLLACIDERALRRAGGAALDVPAGLRAITFRKRVDVAAVLALARDPSWR